MTTPPKPTEEEQVRHVAALLNEHAGKLAMMVAQSLPDVQADPVGLILTDKERTHTTVGVLASTHFRAPGGGGFALGAFADEIAKLIAAPPGPKLRIVVADFSFPVLATVRIDLPPPEIVPG